MQQYPYPPRKPSALQTFLRLPRILQIIIGLVVAFLVIFVGSAAIAGIASSGTPATNTPTTVAAQATSTSPPKPTATFTPSGPHILTGATIGGLQDAFQAKYGNPSGTGTAKTYTFDKGLVTATPAGDASSDGKNHVVSLRIGPSSGQWDAATAQPICEAFLPPDAQFLKAQDVAGFGPERVYTSASLALSFGAGAFNGAAPGTFSMELWPGVGFNTGCIIVLGEG